MTEQRDPFEPPKARVEDEPRPGPAVKAILAGIIVDLGGSTIGGIVFGVAYFIVRTAMGASQEDIVAATSNADPLSFLFIAGGLIGCGFSVLGGYVCANIAKEREFASGFVVALVSTAFAIYYSSEFSIGVILLLAALTFASVMGGVKIGYARNNRKRRAFTA